MNTVGFEMSHIRAKMTAKIHSTPRSTYAKHLMPDHCLSFYFEVESLVFVKQRRQRV